MAETMQDRVRVIGLTEDEWSSLATLLGQLEQMNTLVLARNQKEDLFNIRKALYKY